jgi:alkaline phosphatase
MPRLFNRSSLIVALCFALGLQVPDRLSAQRAPTVPGAARRVILYIGDGMGDSEITIARYYSAGAAGRLAMDTLPFTGTMTTYAVMEDDPARPVYVPASAATATAWSTGTKTSNGRISTEPRTDRILRTIVELAQERGLRTGDVTTAELTDATPAAPAAHVTHRSCQGPDDMERCPQNRKRAGGLGAIAEQLVDRQVDVLLGGGAQRFGQRTDPDRRF